MIDTAPQLLSVNNMATDYQTLFLKLANKIFRQGAYYRKQARILRSKADNAEYPDDLLAEANQLDKSASDMEFISEKAVEHVDEPDRAVIQTLSPI